MPDSEAPASRLMRFRAAVPLGRLLFAFAAIAVLVAGFQSYRAWKIVSDVKDGRAFLRTGQARIETRRLDSTPDDLNFARTQFAAAGQRFASARSRIEDDPLLSIARHLPIASGQIDSAIALARIGESGAAIGSDGVDAAQAFNEVRAQPDGTLPEKTVRVFDNVDPHVASIKTRLADVDQMRAGIGDRSLIGPMRSAIRELDSRQRRLQDFLDTYTRARDFSPDFLGFSAPKTYLILAQNQAELMPAGGLVSVVGTVQLDHGHINDMQFQDAVQFGYDWMDRTHDYVEPPAPLKQYLLKDTSWNLAVSNWSPDFPTSARSARRFWELGGGQHVDGVIAIDVIALERLLAVTGPVDLPEFDVTVNADNAFDLTEQYTRAPYEPNADRKAFAGVLADHVLRKVLKPEPGQWSGLVDVLQQLGDEKDMQIYVSDARQQDLVSQFGWDGAIKYTSGDYLALVDASVNSTKLNAVINHTADIEVQLGSDGAATTTVTLDYDNDLATWERGRDPELVTKLMLLGLYGGYTRILTPPGSKIISVSDGTNEIGLEEASSALGVTAFGRFFAMPRDTKQRLVFKYTTPPVVQKDGSGWTYRLSLRRQPGWEQSAMTVRVIPPGGMRTTETRIDRDVVASGGETKIDLSRDRVLTLSLKPA